MAKIWGIDINVYLLGVVSFLTDISSEAIFSVFSIFFTVILGASAALLGLIEGLADFAASSLDYVSGMLSDRMGKRKMLAGVGYGFSTVAKALLILANTVVIASLFRVIERLGKSFRGPPRDAWLASLTGNKHRGLSFGLHKALDKSGAIIGPLIAYFILSALGQNKHAFTVLFVIALVPAILAVLLILFIKEKPVEKAPRENIFKAYKGFSVGFKRYLLSSGIFSLSYFSFGFLLLKAYLVGFAIKDVVLLYALFNVSFVIFAVPIGKAGDLFGRKIVIYSEYILYALMSIGFVFAQTRMSVIVLFVIFGIFYAIDESQSKAYISDLEKKRGSAIGFYNFITGVIYLPASLIAGFLWKLNPSYAFGFATLLSLTALVIFFDKRDIHKLVTEIK